MNQMEILLKQVKFDDAAVVLKEATLQKVVVTKATGEYHFYIASDESLPFVEFSGFMKAMESFPFPAYVSIDVKTPLYLKEEVVLYVQYAIQLLTKDRPQYAFARNLSFEYVNDRVVFEVLNRIQEKQLTPLFRELIVALEDCGFKLNVEAKQSQENEEYRRMQEEMEKQLDASIQMEVVKEKKPDIPKPVYKAGGNKTTSYKKDYNFYYLKDIVENVPVKVQGYIFKTDMTTTRAGRHIQSLWITDYTDSITVKRFDSARTPIEELEKVKKGGVWVEITGTANYDSYSRETVLIASTLEQIDGPETRKDNAEVKRVELHTHTQMSAMDGIGTISQYISRAAKWGHTAIAVTDHGNVQSFPEAQGAAKKNGIKMIYGSEMNIIDPVLKSVMNPIDAVLKECTFVSFDLETTGLSVFHDGITEFGAVKMRNGEVLEGPQNRKDFFINPQREIPLQVVNLTHITNDMVKNQPTIEERIDEILEFFGDAVLVAHNATFDIGFLNEALRRMGREPIKNTVIDTLPLARAILKPMKSYRLGSVSRVYHVEYNDEVAHRADYDAEVLGHVFSNMIFAMQRELDITNINQINDYQDTSQVYKLVYPYHATMLAKDKVGLKNLFKLVTEANTTYYSEESRLPKELVNQYHQGILVGSSCYRSELFEAALNGSDDLINELLDFYDYIEIQPIDLYEHLVNRGTVHDIDDVKKSIRRLITLAKAKDKLIVATGDVHFLDPNDAIYRDVFISNPTIGLNHRPHPLCDRRHPDAPNPKCYFRTTQEMMDSFTAWMSYDEAYEYVITNPNKIADMCESYNVVHDKLYTPTIDGADEKLTELCYNTAHAWYGDELPEIVEKRIERELGSIIKHGFGVIYYIAHRLVKKSNEDGYLVGSRGSVGSSFVATMTGITEVNPLRPHYRCPNCRHSEFDTPEEYSDGYDLPDKVCPVCGTPMIGDGHNIPFETFLGFNADKVPDIDLNFSGDNQWQAHEYTKVLFGEDKVYRAGTISTVADKTAYGYARGYAELMGRDGAIRTAELERIAMGCTGVKRTTGQHPGGIIVIPREMDVYDFTPVQYPADDLTALWKTTHFDFHAIHDNVLKLDILGHVDPTVIRMLQDLTHIDPKSIPTNDRKVMSLFNSTEAMNIDLGYINCKTGALGLPEFGTPFVRGMLEQCNPNSFADLLVISGLSHGTDVYLGNADLLIKSGTCTIREVIGCRDDIMVYLMEHGLEPIHAFKIMEFVRKGQPSKNKDGWAEWVKVLEENNIAQWYIDSCAKIKYMFPKAHAAAYVLSAIRVAWWKFYYPQEYYSVYFTTRCDAYEIETMIKGKEAVLQRYREIEKLKNEHKSTNKDDSLYVMFEICLEMFERGYHFTQLDLNRSAAQTFTPDPDDPYGIIPSFSCVDGLGGSVADTIIQARDQKAFISLEDVRSRTRLSNTLIETLTKMGTFDGMQRENQMSLFDNWI